jgi:hypothetical protein
VAIKRGVASIERDNLIVFYCLIASDIWSDIRGVAFSGSGFIRGELPLNNGEILIVLSVLLQYTDSDYPLGIFKLFFYLHLTMGWTDKRWDKKCNQVYSLSANRG